MVTANPTASPLFLTWQVEVGHSYAYRVDRTAQFGVAATLIMFSEPPLLCYDTLNCSSNGMCNANGLCDCFKGFYGSDCGGNT